MIIQGDLSRSDSFYEAFMFLQFGPATAVAWILGSMMVGFSVIQLKRLSRMEFKASR